MIQQNLLPKFFLSLLDKAKKRRFINNCYFHRFLLTHSFVFAVEFITKYWFLICFVTPCMECQWKKMKNLHQNLIKHFYILCMSFDQYWSFWGCDLTLLMITRLHLHSVQWNSVCLAFIKLQIFSSLFNNFSQKFAPASNK